MALLKNKAQSILNEKNSKIKPENIKAGVTIFDVEGTLNGGNELPDPGLPAKIRVNPLEDNEFIITTNLDYNVNYKIVADVEITTEEETWIADGVSINWLESDENNKLVIHGTIHEFIFNISDVISYKINFYFVLENYYPKIVNSEPELIRPDVVRLQTYIFNDDHTEIPNTITASDIIITNSNDEDVTNQVNLVVYEGYYTSCFSFDLPCIEPIDTYHINVNYQGDENKKVLFWEFDNQNIRDMINQNIYKTYNEFYSCYHIPTIYSYHITVLDAETELQLIGGATVKFYSDEDCTDLIDTETMTFDGNFEFGKEEAKSVEIDIHCMGYVDGTIRLDMNDNTRVCSLYKTFVDTVKQRVTFTFEEEHPTIEHTFVPVLEGISVTLYEDREKTISYNNFETVDLVYYNDMDPEHIYEGWAKHYIIVDDIGKTIYYTVTDSLDRYTEDSKNGAFAISNEPQRLAFQLIKKSE